MRNPSNELRSGFRIRGFTEDPFSPVTLAPILAGFMPEGHTLHRLALDLTRDLVGNPLRASSPQGRFEGALALDGDTLTAVEAVGKHLLLHFTRGVVHVHLGLFGRFRGRKNPPLEPRPTVRLRLEGASHTWDLVGPTCCESLNAAALLKLRERLGADPLSAVASPQAAYAKLKKTTRPIGAVLLDQRILSGIGNVYRAEILFLLKIHPQRAAKTLSPGDFERLWQLSQELLTRGVKARRIVTTPHEPGKRPRRSETLYVYRRRECRVCAGPIRSWLLASRTMYACERCQRLESTG